MVAARDEGELNKVKIESQLHHFKADQAYKDLKEDTMRAKGENKINVICVDLQQLLFCPT